MIQNDLHIFYVYDASRNFAISHRDEKYFQIELSSSYKRYM